MQSAMDRHIDRVQQDEGHAFMAVLLSLAESGESKSSAASLLDIPQTSLCKWIRDNVFARNISWPKKGESNGFLENVKNNTPARRAARLRNLKLANKKPS